jgi:hypothetical protein
MGLVDNKCSNVKLMKREVQTLAQENGIESFLKNGVPIDLRDQIIEIIKKYNVGGQLSKDTFVGEIHDRKDPRAWLSGNYMGNCMAIDYHDNTNPELEGLNQKLMEYITFPETQIFSVSKNERMIASSVVMMGDKGIILDNIETNPNHSRPNAALIGRIYQVFWSIVTEKEVQLGSQYSTNKPFLSAQVPSKDKMQIKQNYYYDDYAKGPAWSMPKVDPSVINLMEKVLGKIRGEQ